MSYIERRVQFAHGKRGKCHWKSLSAAERGKSISITIGGKNGPDERLLHLFESTAAMEHSSADLTALDELLLVPTFSGQNLLHWTIFPRGRVLDDTGLELLASRGFRCLPAQRKKNARSLQGLLVKAGKSRSELISIVYLAMELRWAAVVEISPPEPLPALDKLIEIIQPRRTPRTKVKPAALVAAKTWKDYSIPACPWEIAIIGTFIHCSLSTSERFVLARAKSAPPCPNPWKVF